ncbi:MAG: DUF1501 domain-containing protein [Terriglobia bacterium]
MKRSATGESSGPQLPHFAPKAKHVIFMFMEEDGNSNCLMKMALPKSPVRQSLPPSPSEGSKTGFYQAHGRRYGESLQIPGSQECQCHFPIAAPYQFLRRRSCLIRMLHTSTFNHHPLITSSIHGSITDSEGRLLGCMVGVGLRSESQNLPSFVVLTSGVGTSGGASNFSSGFLPSHYQGTVFRNSGDPILYLSNPSGINQASRSWLWRPFGT